MDIREVDSDECCLARTYTGQVIGIVIGSSGPYVVQTIMRSGRRVHGHGMVFVPLSAFFEVPADEGWTKVIVVSGEYKGYVGFVRVIEYDAGQDLMRGNLNIH